jgi:hypothetical protein
MNSSSNGGRTGSMHANKLIAAAALLGACGGDPEECVAPTIDEAACDPAIATFTLASTNPYYPLKIGSVAILEGTEDGAQIRIERRVLGETLDVLGVVTRVLESKELVDGQLVELARNYYAETSDGTVCYFGEDVDFFENGVLVNHDGTWRAGVRSAKPGIIMPAMPKVGDAYNQEVAPGIAMDQGRVTATGATMTFAGTSYSNVITVVDTNPLDEEAPCEEETKLYAPGVGEAADTGKMLMSFTPGMD